MEFKICVDAERCIRCRRCVEVCPSLIFEQKEPKGKISIHKPENCIVCGHCAAVCPTAAVCHEAFPAETVHAVDRAALPTPEQVEMLIASRRSMRNFTKEPVSQEAFDRIVKAADYAPTATNARELAYVLVTDPETLRGITEYTLTVFGRVLKRVQSVLVKPWLRFVLPDVYRYVPVFKKARREYEEEGIDRILRGATAVLVIHAPKKSRFADIDANLAYQNASLMAESLGVGQVYMGFVLSAARQDKSPTLNRLLGIGDDRRICAVMALGIPRFRYPNYVDREAAGVRKK